MDGLIEKFCYCSFNLCNTATRTNLSVSVTLSHGHTVTLSHCDNMQILDN